MCVFLLISRYSVDRGIAALSSKLRQQAGCCEWRHDQTGEHEFGEGLCVFLLTSC